MVTRLVLGSGTVANRLIEVASRYGRDLLVVTDDESLVETLREENVRAIHGDPTAESVLGGFDDPAIVLTATDDVQYSLEILDAARACYPEAVFVAGLGTPVDDEERIELERFTSHVVDAPGALVDTIVDGVATPAAENARLLREHLRSIDGRLAVVAHDNPDPDAIASAVGLAHLASSLGIDAEACYYGSISHQENRAMINLLDLDLHNLDRDDSLDEYGAFALVDHARAGVNDQLPEELHIDVVVDHHPPRGPIQATFLDLRESVGATSTIVTEYLQTLGVGFDRDVATALLYGIRIDTKEFSREASTMDFTAAATLMAHVDHDALGRIESPSIDAETYETVGRAIRNREIREQVVVANAERIASRDALPQAADQLLNMEGVNTSLVFGFVDDEVYVSARSRQSDLDLGETLRDAFGQIGSAGGHANMAGAQLRIGAIAGDEQPDDVHRVAAEVITERFFEAVHPRPSPISSQYLPMSDRLSTLLLDANDEAPSDDRPS